MRSWCRWIDEALAAGPFLRSRSGRPRAGARAPRPRPSPAVDAATPTFAAGVEVVTVDAVVTDKKNATISGIPREEFTILEDGVPQEITSFENVQVPANASAEPARKPAISDNTTREERTGRSFVIVFDDVHLTLFQAHRAKLAIGQFLKTGVREGDRVTIVATGGGAWWSTRMEAGREDVMSLLKRLEGRLIPDNSPERMSDSEALRIHIYRDQQAEERVARRFDSFGTNGRSPERPGQRSARPATRSCRAARPTSTTRRPRATASRCRCSTGCSCRSPPPAGASRSSWSRRASSTTRSSTSSRTSCRPRAGRTSPCTSSTPAAWAAWAT